jgi:sortase A
MNNDKPDDNLSSEPNAAAIDLIRQKLDQLYSKPVAKAPETSSKELKPIGPKTVTPPSIHQVFRDKLVNSGKLVSEIQTEWHNYYLSLNDDEKREVWDEFYKNNTIEGEKIDHPEQFEDIVKPADREPEEGDDKPLKKNRKPKKPLTKRKHIAKSIIFGLSIGIVCIVIFLFGFFNEVFIAPFITPSKSLSVDSVIVNNGTVSISPNPVIIIPKINVEIPVVYTVDSLDDSAIEAGLQQGVVHYYDTAYPGQDGNGVIFGHSAGNIFNPGLYKYAFSLLHYLQIGDTFTINYESKSYTYQVFNKFIVSPSDVSVVNPIAGHTATFTLITCNPPGLSTDRLIIQADQVNPNPALNTAVASPIKISALPKTLPSESPTLWSRFVSIF